MGKKKGRSLGIMIVLVLFLLSGITMYVFGTNAHQNISLSEIPETHPKVPPHMTPIISEPKVIKDQFLLSTNQSILRSDSPLLKHDGMYHVHFIHIPKCGGTSMTAVLREMMCAVDPIHNVDCCTNPGFCDYSSGRKCSVIKGCINHFPNRSLSSR